MKKLIIITISIAFLVPNVWPVMAEFNDLPPIKPIVEIGCSDMVLLCIDGSWQWVCVGEMQ